jgi:hypothetical protein
VQFGGGGGQPIVIAVSPAHFVPNISSLNPAECLHGAYENNQAVPNVPVSFVPAYQHTHVPHPLSCYCMPGSRPQSKPYGDSQHQTASGMHHSIRSSLHTDVLRLNEIGFRIVGRNRGSAKYSFSVRWGWYRKDGIGAAMTTFVGGWHRDVRARQPIRRRFANAQEGV